MQEELFNRDQVIALCKICLEIAKVDGMTEAEKNIIISFYEGYKEDFPNYNYPTIDDIDNDNISFDIFKLFNDNTIKHVILTTCLIIGYADGELTKKEVNFIETLFAPLLSLEYIEKKSLEMGKTMFNNIYNKPDFSKIESFPI